MSKENKALLKLAKRLRIEIVELDRMTTDLPEVDIHVDLDYQAARLRTIADRLRKIAKDADDAGTNIHGGGTGED